MRIEDAKKAYSAHLNTLQDQKNTLRKLLQDSENMVGNTPNYDRVEISRELSEIDAEYEATQKIIDHILSADFIIQSSIAAKLQSEAAAEGIEELGKILTIYRRIASGAHVPPKDEYRLMEFSHELYMAAKAAAILKHDNDEEYDSLWEDEENPKPKEKSAEEIAGDTQISVPPPEQISVAAVPE